MGVVVGIVDDIWNILVQMVPRGMDPVIFWLSFLIIFALTYLVLIMTHIFGKKGEEHKGIAALVAMIIAYFAAGSAFSSIFMSYFFPNLTIGLWALLGISMVLIVAGFKGKGGGLLGIIAFIVVMFVIFATWQGASAKLGIQSGALGLSAEDYAMLVILGFFALLGYYAFKSPSQQESVWDKMEKFFGGKHG